MLCDEEVVGGSADWREAWSLCFWGKGDPQWPYVVEDNDGLDGQSAGWTEARRRMTTMIGQVSCVREIDGCDWERQGRRRLSRHRFPSFAVIRDGENTSEHVLRICVHTPYIPYVGS